MIKQPQPTTLLYQNKCIIFNNPDQGSPKFFILEPYEKLNTLSKPKVYKHNLFLILQKIYKN